MSDLELLAPLLERLDTDRFARAMDYIQVLNAEMEELQEDRLLEGEVADCEMRENETNR